MQTIDTIEALEALYEAAHAVAITKVLTKVTPNYARWIEASRFMVLCTVGPEGTDGSPRGDDGPVVRIADDKTLLIPDWRGNNRLDSLRNIVRDGRVSLMFLVPGESNVVRINGTAKLTADPALTETFEQAGAHPKTVIVITVGEVYFQCAKSILRSRLWSGQVAEVPSAGELVKDADAAFDDEGFDKGYLEAVRTTMW